MAEPSQVDGNRVCQSQDSEVRSLASLLRSSGDDVDHVGQDPRSMRQRAGGQQAVHTPGAGQAAQQSFGGDNITAAQHPVTMVGGVEPFVNTTEGQPTSANNPQVVGGRVPKNGVHKNTRRSVRSLFDRFQKIVKKWIREDPQQMMWATPLQRVTIISHLTRQPVTVSTFDPVVDRFMQARLESGDFDQLMYSLQKERDSLVTWELISDHVDRFIRNEAYSPQAQLTAFAAGVQQPTCRLPQGEQVPDFQPSTAMLPATTDPLPVSSVVASMRAVHQVQLGDSIGVTVSCKLLTISRQQLLHFARNLLGQKAAAGAMRVQRHGLQRQAWGFLLRWSHRAVLYQDWNYASKPELALSIVAQLCYLSHTAGKGQDWGLLPYGSEYTGKTVSLKLHNTLQKFRQGGDEGQTAYSMFDTLCGGGKVDWSGAMWQATGHIIEAVVKEGSGKTRRVPFQFLSKQLQLPVDLVHILPWNFGRVVNAVSTTLYVCLQLTNEVLATTHVVDSDQSQVGRGAMQQDEKQAAVWNIAETFVVALLMVLIGNGARNDQDTELLDTVYQTPCFAMSEAGQLSGAVVQHDALCLTEKYNNNSSGLKDAVQQACEQYPKNGSVGMRLGWYDAAVRNVIAGFGYQGWRRSGSPIAYGMDRSDAAEQTWSIVAPLIQWITLYKASEVGHTG